MSLQGDQIVLDVDEVIDQVKERLVARGLTIVQNVPIPETDRQIVLMDAPQVRQLRTIYAFGNPLAQWLLPVVGVLYLAALRAGSAPSADGGGDRCGRCGQRAPGGARAVDRAPAVRQPACRHGFGPASRVFFDTLLAYLERGQQVLLGLGLILIVAVWFAGANRYGTAVRTRLAGGLEDIGSSLGDGAASGPGRWVAANLTWLRVVAIAAGAVVLIWGNNVTVSRLCWSLALVVVILSCLQVLAGAGRDRSQAGSLDPDLAIT